MKTVSDDFNRPDAPDLGPGWVSHNGILAIADGMVYPTGSPNYTWCYSSSTTVMVGGDMEVSITFGPSNSSLDHALMYLGANAAGECLFAYFYQNNAYFFTQGAWASYGLVAGPASLPQAEGDTLTLRRVGTLYDILKNGAATGIGYATAAIPIDASHNQVGFAIYSDNGSAHRKIDSFSAHDYSADAALSGSGTLSATVEVVTPPSGFTPTDLSGCTVWLDATQLSSLTTQWTDLSGNNNHGAVVGTPAPTIENNSPYGLPVVRFKANEGRVRGSGMYPAETPNSSFTVIFVGHIRAGGVSGRIFTNPYPPFNFLVGTHASGRNACFDAGWINSGVAWTEPYDQWTTWGFVYTGNPNLGTFFVDGVESGSGSGGGAHDPRWNLSGYSDTGAEETCDCEVAELITYDRALTTTERQQVEDYLHAKWFEEGGGPEPIPVAATLTGSGTLTSTATERYNRFPSVIASGSLSATIKPVVPKAAPLNAAGTLSATVKKIAAVPASLGSTGQLQVTVSPSGGETPPDGGGGTRPWEITPGTPTPHRPAPSWGSSPVLLAPHKKLGGWEAKLDRVGQFRGQGSLNAVVAPTVRVGAVFASEGTLTPNLLWRGYRTIFFGGGGTLYADPQPFLTRPISALFSGSGYLSSFIDDDGFTAIIRKGIAALLSGGGNLGVDLGGGITYPDGLSALVWERYLRIAGFSSEAQLLATLDRLQAGIAAYAGEGSLNATVSPVIAVLAQLTGSGVLTAGQAGGVSTLAQLLGTGQLSATLFARKLADAGFSGAGALTTLLLQSHQSTSTGGGEGTVSALIFARYLLAAALSGGGTLSTLLAQVYALAGAFGGDGALSASMFQKLFSTASMSGGGTLAAGAFQSYLCAASMGGGGSLTATASIAFTPFTETNQPKTNAARPAGTSGCWVTLIGGGASGGTGYGAVFQNCGGGGGGGGGGLISRSFIPVASLGSTYSVVIGAKGVGANGTASSFSSGSGSASANGGTKGGNGGSGAAGTAGAGGTTTISGFTGLTALNGGAGGAGTLASAGVAGANQTTTAPGGGGGAGRGGAGQTYAGGKGGNSATAAGGAASGGNGAAAAAGNPGGGGAGGVSTNGTGGSAGDAGVYGAGGGGGGGGNSTGPAGDGSAGTTVIEWV